MTQHGGRRPGAGRKPGYRLRRTANEVLSDLGKRFPGWSPLVLLAEIANDATQELPLRLDAAKALAVYVHPKPKPAEFEPEAAIEFEKQLAQAVTEVKLAAAAKVTEEHPGMVGLADRLEDAWARLQEVKDREAVERQAAFKAAVAAAVEERLRSGDDAPLAIAPPSVAPEPKPAEITPEQEQAEPEAESPPVTKPEAKPAPTSGGDWNRPAWPRAAYVDLPREPYDPFANL